MTTAIVALAGGTAIAANSNPAARVDAQGIPPQCDQFRTVPPDSRSVTLPWEQRLSLAACRQQLTLEPITNASQLKDALARIDREMAPSIATYQDAIANGPTPQIRIMGAYGLAMAHRNSIVIARSAIDLGFSGQSTAYTNPQLTAYTRLHDQLEPMLMAHRDAAVAAFDTASQLAEANPTASRSDAVMRNTVADIGAERNAMRQSPTANTARR